tara:strand:+ start:347 stop:499 length:153 start_codon:yes stop_codon:yes gene_type:complete
MIIAARINVTPFAITIDMLPTKQPYKSQRESPIKKIKYIAKEIPTALFSL